MSVVVGHVPVMAEGNSTPLGGWEEGNMSVNASSVPVHPLVVLSEDIVFFSLSLIIPLGLIFNSMAIWVLLSATLRKRSANLYLAALALSDDISLITLLFDYWLKHRIVDVPIVKSSAGFCIVVTHLSYASRLFSSMLITSFTIERFIGVVYPLKRAVLTSSSHVRRVLILESIICLVVTAFTTFTIDVVDTPYGRHCDVRPDRAHIYLVCNVLFLVFGANIIPIVVICSLNAFSLNKICSRRTHMMHNKHFSCRVRKGYNTATVLLTVSTVFVILTLPYCIAWVLLFFRHFHIGGALAHVPSHRLMAAKYITSVPYYLNYSINFLLYNLCAQAFRKELSKTMCAPYRIYRRKRHACRRQSTSSTHQVYLYSSGRCRKENYSPRVENGRCIQSHVADRPNSRSKGEPTSSSSRSQNSTAKEKKYFVVEDKVKNYTIHYQLQTF